MTNISRDVAKSERRNAGHLFSADYIVIRIRFEFWRQCHYRCSCLRSSTSFAWCWGWRRCAALSQRRKSWRRLSGKKLSSAIQTRWISHFYFQPNSYIWFQGGDPIEFKKLNDAYLKLIGHIQKVNIQIFKNSNIQKVKDKPQNTNFINPDKNQANVYRWKFK